jgi:hypothetical protein
MSYLDAVSENINKCAAKCGAKYDNYLDAFKHTKQMPSILHQERKLSKGSFRDIICSKKQDKILLEVTSIPYYKPKQPKKKDHKRKIPKFVVFLLLPYFNKLSGIWHVLLPQSFSYDDFYSCTVCHLVSTYWRSSGVLTTYNCFTQYDH